MILSVLGLAVVYISFFTGKYHPLQLKSNLKFFCQVIAYLSTSYGIFYGGKYVKHLRFSNHFYNKIKRSQKLINTFFNEIKPEMDDIDKRVREDMNRSKDDLISKVLSKSMKAKSESEALIKALADRLRVLDKAEKKAMYASKLKELSSRKARDFFDNSQSWASAVNAEIKNKVINLGMMKSTIKKPFVNFMNRYEKILIHERLQSGYKSFFDLKHTLNRL